MKKFVGKINERNFTDEVEFYEALQTMKANGIEIKNMFYEYTENNETSEYSKSQKSDDIVSHEKYLVNFDKVISKINEIEDSETCNENDLFEEVNSIMKDINDELKVIENSNEKYDYSKFNEDANNIIQQLNGKIERMYKLNTEYNEQTNKLYYHSLCNSSKIDVAKELIEFYNKVLEYIDKKVNENNKETESKFNKENKSDDLFASDNVKQFTKYLESLSNDYTFGDALEALNNLFYFKNNEE